MYPSGVRAREYICIYVCMYVCAMGIENLDERMGQILRSGYEGGGGLVYAYNQTNSNAETLWRK